MLTKTIISGFGGQGVLFMGHSLAGAAMEAGFYTTYLPSYGAEVRGGTANCTVAVSDEPIASPVASEPEYIIAMNNPSITRFQSHLVRKGKLFINADMVDMQPTRDDIDCIRIPVVTIANNLNAPRSANIVMLGAFLRHTNLIGYSFMERVIADVFAEKSKKLVQPNLAALHAGFDWNVA